MLPPVPAAEREDLLDAKVARAANARLRTIVSTPLGVAAIAAVLLVVVTAVLAPMLWAERASTFDTSALSQGPSSAHWLGTDNLGRDIGLRVLVATRLAVGLALAATAIGFVGGVVIGASTALAGRRTSRVVSAGIDVAVAFPGLLLAIFFAIIFGVGKLGAVLALGIAAAPWFARLTHTLIASVMGREYVAAARVMGLGRLTVLRRHVLPNVAEPLLINATMGAGGHLLAFAGLSFIGIGVQPPDYDWGRLLLEGIDNIYLNPAGALGPGLAIVVAGLAFNLTGELGASALGGRHRRVPAAPQASPPAGRRTPGADDAVVTVRDLRVLVPGEGGWVEAVRGVDLDVRAGETLGLVGESGSGKSLTAMAVVGLLPISVVARAGVLEVVGLDLATTPARRLRRELGDAVSVVFQDPSTSLNPVIRVGAQPAEVARQHHEVTRRAARARAVEVLGQVHVPEPARRAKQYPHEFSGGMRQRAMIGIGLMGRPRLVVADEPTTALDVTVQRQVLDLLDEVAAETHSGSILISHDLAVVADRSDRVAVMYAGRVVEQLAAADLHTSARHPYTRALVGAVPDLGTDRDLPLATIPGRPPRLEEVPVGCAFAARCALATDRCREQDPALEWSDGAAVACWHPVSADGGVG
ncbi:MAG: ABC transporter permease subunit [Actinobacteria bacterium]|nr:ABC transporter permease subunit [Actinomycetota bacterium]